MAATEWTVEQWLTQIAGNAAIPEDKRKVILETLSDKQIADNLKKQHLAPADYSRKMDELKADRDRLEAANRTRQEQLANDFKSLTEFRAKANEQIQQVNQTLTAAQQREAKLREAVVKVTKDYELSPADLGLDSSLLSPMDVTPRPTPQPATQPNGGGGDKPWVSREDLAKLHQDFSAYPVELHDIGVRHRKIFGEDIELGPLYEQALRERRPVMDVWLETHKVQERVRANEEATFQKRLDEEREKGRLQGRQEAIRVPGAPPGAGDMPHAPVFQVSDREAPPPPIAGADAGQSRADYLGHAAESLLLRRNTTQPSQAA